MKQHFFRFTAGMLVFVFVQCSDSGKSLEEKGNQADLEGRWKARWTTSKEAFPEVGDDISLTMEGWVTFQEDEVTITAYGYPGCIFSADTLEHSQKWFFKNDTLELVNDGDLHGISYLLKERSEDKIELVLMDDIYLSLSR